MARRIEGTSSPTTSRRARRGQGLAAGSALLASAWLGSAPAAAAPPPVPDDHAMQWPLGQCVEDKLVAGHLYDVLQDYDQHNTSVGRCSSMSLKCRHAGYDMHRSDAPERTFDDPVLAMADGVVVDLIDWGDEGVGVLVEHDNGLYAHYVHLRKESNVVHVRRGQRVRAGQPLGQIMSYPYGTNNDHLHLEIRRGLYVRSCTSGQDCVEPEDFVTSCKGNGYALAAATAGIEDVHAADYGFSDPTDAYFDNRPPFPATIAVERTPLDYFEAAGGTAALGRLPTDTLMSAPEEPMRIGEDAWYAVSVVEGESTVTRWARGFHDLGFGGDIGIGEVPQIGREWTPPTSAPLVDLRFGATGRSTNWGTGADATVTGTLTTTPPYTALPADHCDQVAALDGATHLAVAVGKEEASFEAGVVLDLSLRLDALEGAGTIATSGDPETPTWRLAVRKDDDEVRRLVFEVTTAAEEVQSIVMELPEPRCAAAGPVPPSACDGVWSAATAECPATACDPDQGMPAHCFEDFGYRQWRHVAARYDRAASTLELFWDGMSVQELTVSGALLDAEDRSVRIGEGLAGAVDDVRVWALGAVDEGEGDDKSDALGDWGGSRTNEGCSCTTGPGSGAGTLPLLLGLWALRRRRSR